MEKAPFPLRSVLPILVSASSFLKTKEDREDAIQDAWEQILLMEKRLAPGPALIRRIAYTRACAIYRKNKRIARYFNVYKSLDTVEGAVYDSSAPEDPIYPESTVRTLEERELAEEIVYRRHLGQMLYKKLQLCSKKQQSLIMLLMMGCTYQEIDWIRGKPKRSYRVGGDAFGLFRRRIINSINPEVRKEIESEYRGISRKGGWVRKQNRRLFYEDPTTGKHVYARPRSRAHELYQQIDSRDPIEVGKMLEGASL